MKTIIKFLNVGKGDSIIVNIKDENDSFVALIDGGTEGCSEYVYIELSKVLKENNKDGPDLVICSHYDRDHIGGLIKLTKIFNKNIKLFWIQKPDSSLEYSLKIIEEAIKPDKKNILNEESKIFKMSLLGERHLLDEAKYIFESLTQLDSLVKIINKFEIPNQRPYSDKIQIEKWGKYFELLGPTKSFFDQFKPNMETLLEYTREEAYFELNERPQLRVEKFKQYTNPCINLLNTSKLSKSNRTCTIIRINDSDNNEYLLTADADIEAINDVLKRNIFSKKLIMQIPHHGSLNNLSKHILDTLNPQTSIISANGSEHHPHLRITKCLESRNIKMYSTHKYGIITIENGRVTTER
jgi:beta-lactamase superfamily II metal-dependent hydrolase